jgi:hypothetical protein
VCLTATGRILEILWEERRFPARRLIGLARSCRQGVVGAAPSNVIKGCAVWCGQPQDTCSGGSDVDERHHLFAPLSERRAPRAEAEDQQRLHHKPLRGIGGDIQGRSRGAASWGGWGLSLAPLTASFGANKRANTPRPVRDAPSSQDAAITARSAFIWLASIAPVIP